MSNWVKVDEERDVAFDFPCDSCTKQDPAVNRNHGHVRISCEDGGAWIPFRCFSQAGVRFLVAMKDSISEEEKRVIINLPEVKNLPNDLSEEEGVTINNTEELKRQLTYGFHGTW